VIIRVSRRTIHPGEEHELEAPSATRRYRRGDEPGWPVGRTQRRGRSMATSARRRATGLEGTTPMPRTDVPAGWDEPTILTTFLDSVRATVHANGEHLAEADARRARRPGSPPLTLAGLANHRRRVESCWFQGMLLGEEDQGPWTRGGPDRELGIAVAVPVARLLAEDAARCARNRGLVASLGLGSPSRRPVGSGPVTLGWILLHLVEETARHNGPVAQLHHGRRLHPAGVHPEQPTAAQLDQGRLVEHLHLQAGTRPDLAGDLAHAGGGQVPGGAVGQVAAQRGRLGDDAAPPGSSLGVGHRVLVDHQAELGQLHGVVLAADVEVVAAQHGALDDGLGGRGDGDLGEAWKVQREPAQVGQRTGEGGGRVAQLVGRHRSGLTDPDGDPDRLVAARQEQGLADLAVEPARAEGGAIGAQLVRDRSVGGDEDGSRLDGGRLRLGADGDRQALSTVAERASGNTAALPCWSCSPICLMGSLPAFRWTPRCQDNCVGMPTEDPPRTSTTYRADRTAISGAPR
jgi:hypothetical protein